MGLATFGEVVAGQRDHALVERGNAATRVLPDLFQELLADVGHDSREDLLTLLAASPTTTDEEHAELLANCLFFLLAGHATTASLLGAGAALLAERPYELERLLRDPAA